jgi:hypothetical protein
MGLNRNHFFLTIALCAALLAISACSKLCKTGYEGSRCNELTITKFEGVWNAVDTPGNLVYVDTINKGPAINDITLSILFAGHHFSHVINASVADSVITIPYQQPDTGANFVTGTGTLSADNNHILLFYKLVSGLDSPQVVTNCTGTWTRQN